MRWWNLWITSMCLVINSPKADSCSEALEQCVNTTDPSSGNWSCKNTCISEDQTSNLQEKSIISLTHAEPGQTRSIPDNSLPNRDCIQCICECSLQQPSMTTTSTCTATMTQCTSLTTSVMPISGVHQESDSRVATALICLAVIVVLVHVVGGVVFAAIRLRRRARRRTETLPPWPQSIRVTGRALHNPAYSAERFVSPPTTLSQPAIYEEVEVSTSFCSEDEPEKLVQIRDVTHTTPRMPSHVNQKTSQLLLAVYREPVRKNVHGKEGLVRSTGYSTQGEQSGIHRGEHPANSPPMQAQGYAKLDITTRCTCLESHRGGKVTKNIATPLSISHDYSRLEQ